MGSSTGNGSGVDNPLHWRYRRDQHMLYVTAQCQTDAGYVLVCRLPNGHSRAERLGTLSLLYDYLQTLEVQLGSDGWELLPLQQRAPNRLKTPTCDLCPIDRHVDVTTRTKTHVHFRCSGCGHEWIVPKPGAVGPLLS